MVASWVIFPAVVVGACIGVFISALLNMSDNDDK